MPRAPYNTLIIPFIQENDQIQYAIFKCSDSNFWQFIAGGGEEGETVTETALRETKEETGIENYQNFYRLDSFCSIPKYDFKQNWSKSICVIPEYCFALEVSDKKIVLSPEHSEFRWVNYEDADKLLKWDSNKTALWELNHKLIENISL